MTMLLTARGIGKRFGGFTALQGIDIDLAPGERLGLIGPNGSGKSTFVNCLAGAMPGHEGSITFNDRSLSGMAPHQRAWVGLARTFQLPRPFKGMSVLENVCVPLLYPGPGRQGAHSMRQAREIALDCLDRVQLAAKADRRTSELTQVELRKLELARATAIRPSLLIADEVMAGLSHAEVDQILALLFEFNAAGTGIIMIEHIMKAVTEFSQRLVVFVAGRKLADGDPREVLSMPEVEAAYLGQ
jgi:branched-chain amino acid transport system ATP-binding protein